MSSMVKDTHKVGVVLTGLAWYAMQCAGELSVIHMRFEKRIPGSPVTNQIGKNTNLDGSSKGHWPDGLRIVF